uniref:Uncharacterized protein n=1 Tax=Arundo donax TaxID=35708 RepID=A0A0A9BX13_ARUDO
MGASGWRRRLEGAHEAEAASAHVCSGCPFTLELHGWSKAD